MVHTFSSEQRALSQMEKEVLEHVKKIVLEYPRIKYDLTNFLGEIVVHGEYSTYIRQKCRCPDCRKANTEYHRLKREREKAITLELIKDAD